MDLGKKWRIWIGFLYIQSEVLEAHVGFGETWDKH